MKPKMKRICNGKVILTDKVVEADIYIESSTIVDIDFKRQSAHSVGSGVEIIDAAGLYVLPGLIDIHCDAIEKEVQPRPNTLFPMNIALYELEKKLAGNGISTMYHSLSLGTGLSLRGDHLLEQMVNQIDEYRAQRSMIRHRIHLRYEVSHLKGLPLARKLLESGVVEYLSFMNHSPGQGQYRAPGSFEAYVMKNQGVNQEEVRVIVDNLLKLQKQVDWDQLKQIAAFSISKGIRIASHDDDSAEKIDESLAFGISVSEFPLNLETAAYAKKQKLHICAGAPNVVRGKSHDNNMSAMDAIRSGVIDILCSDYLPSSLLLAVFKLAAEGIDLPTAVKMVTLHPAQALGIDQQYGSIEAGKSADLILVQDLDGYPFVHKTMVEGSLVYQADFRFNASPAT